MCEHTVHIIQPVAELWNEKMHTQNEARKVLWRQRSHMDKGPASGADVYEDEKTNQV